MAQTLILDTNIWLDWLVFDDTSLSGIKEAQKNGAVQLVGSQRMRDELVDVLHRDFLGVVYTRKQLAADVLLQAYDTLVTTLPVPPNCPQLRCRDIDDQMFLDLAAHQRVHALLTKDKQVLKLAKPARKWFNVLITRPDAYFV
jgi:uncharacterized protein